MISISSKGFFRNRRGSMAAGFFLAVLFPVGIQGQQLPVGDTMEEYLRVLQISGRATAGTFMVRPFAAWSGNFVGDPDSHPWAGEMERFHLEHVDGGPSLSFETARMRVFANTRTPFGRNDGAVWQGRGLTTALEGGASMNWGPFSATIRPQLIYTQNQSFPLATVFLEGAGEYAYPWRYIDLPQRFGPDPYLTLDPGQTTFRFSVRGASVGFGTENLWWGPGIRNSILMSNNAPGFPHGFLSTARPVDFGIGPMEAQWIWGRLGQSEWFDDYGQEESRFITGAVGVWSPKWLEGLSVGVARVFVTLVPSAGVPARDYFAVLQGLEKKAFVTPENPKGDDASEQLASFIARWVLPESGFEVYAEWARNDHSWDIADFLSEPEHSQGYTLGFQKVKPLSGGHLLALNGELTSLEKSRTTRIRDVPTYYAHHVVIQGYTQRGQILGAGIGPGANAQQFSADLYSPRGRWGVFLMREVRDNDAYFDSAVITGGQNCCHDLYLSAGTRIMVFRGDFELGAETALTRNLNRYFYEGNDLWNLNVALSAQWRPR